MATTRISLTPTWSLVATAAGFVGQKDPYVSVEVRNDTSLPSGSVDCHKIEEECNLQFPAPAAGNWYARVADGSATIVVTEV